MKRWICLTVVFALLISMTGCGIMYLYDEPATLFEVVEYFVVSFGEIGSDIGDAVGEVVDMAKTPEGRHEIGTRIYGEPDDSLPQTGETEERSWLEKLLLCEHSEKVYDPEKAAVTCECGRDTLDDLTLEEFREYVPDRFFDFLRSDEKIEKYITKEFRRYAAANQDLDPDMLAFLMSLNLPELDKEKKKDLDGVMDFLKEMTEVISNGAEFDDGYAKSMKLGTKFFENINTYFGAANKVLTVISTGSEMVNYDQLAKNGGDETEIVHSAIAVLKEATSFIPVGSVVFAETLDTVEEGLKVVIKGSKMKLLRETLYWSELNKGNLKDVRNYWYMENKWSWDKGPSLEDLANANLTKEELCGISIYIEYRIEKEIEKIYGMSLQELVELYNDIG